MSAEEKPATNDLPKQSAPPEEAPVDDEAVEETAPSDGLIRVALDAMGGDNAPDAIIEGALLAVADAPDLRLILVGDEAIITTALERQKGPTPKSVSIRHAEEVIGFDEFPSVALRKKKKSSIHVGIRMVKENEADAFVSAGHTGAVMAVAAVILRTMEGIDRAAIAAPLPNDQGGQTVLLDAGANVVCKATNLYQFGVMGSVYAQYILGEESPRVGVLSIGEEEGKGTETILEAASYLSASSAINYIGNVEAKLLYKNEADVVVCDGFTGNIALKVSESVAGMITGFLKEMLAKNWRGKLAYLLLKPALAEMKKKIDHSEVGGAPLLGVDGAVFISHGSSDQKSIQSALRAARAFIKEDVNGHIRENLANSPDILDTTKMKTDAGIFETLKQKIWPSDKKEPREDEKI